VLKESIINYFEHSANFSNRYSTKEAIIEYLGLGEEENPQGDSWAKKFKYSSRKDFSAQYNIFIDRIKIDDIPEISVLIDNLLDNEIEVINHILNRQEMVIGKIVYFHHIFELLKMHDERLKAYELYRLDLKKVATKNDSIDNLIIVKRTRYKYYKELMKEVVAYSGRNGICNCNEIFNKIELERDKQEIVLKILKCRKDICLFDLKEKKWFLAENNDNYIKHVFQKIINITDDVNVDELICAIIRESRRRTRELQIPPINVIREFIHRTVYCQVFDERAKINLEKRSLSDLEIKLMNLLSNKKEYFYEELSEYMEKDLGIRKGSIIKIIFNSPILYNVNNNINNINSYRIIGSDILPNEEYNYQNEWEEIQEIRELFKNTILVHEKYFDIIAKARIGQGQFRDMLMLDRLNKCEICNITRKEVLIASHIKEFSKCDNKEAYDIDNGLLLCAGHDKLFDRHLISFDEHGCIIISECINRNEYKSLGISEKSNICMNDNKKVYMRQHASELLKF